MSTCRQCQSAFEITDEDRAFYKRVSPEFGGKKYLIPEPTLCPACRQQRRLVWRNDLHLFKRKSDFSGKQTLSMYPPGEDFKVYTHDEWWGDEWDPFEYGRDFDFSRTFFDQFADLMRVVPLVSISVNEVENSDYVNCTSWAKNCYLISSANHDEDCYYGNFVNYCKSCVDNCFIDHCELCYECVDCKDCYNLKYSTNCQNCSDSFFLYSCKDCRNCFGSVNLFGKQYVFMNEQMDKEAYETRVAGLGLDKRSRIQEAKEFFEKHRLKFPYKCVTGEMNEDVSGNMINNCRRTYECFDVTDLEDCKYCTWFHHSKNCMDIYAWGFGAAESYEAMEIGHEPYHTLFGASVYGGSDVYYSVNSRFSHSTFGCVSLHNKKYCVLNKQYTKEEYDALVPRIIEHMIKNKEWGEFFPISLSRFGYNYSLAQDYYPLTEEQAKKIGARWYHEPKEKVIGAPVAPPDSILDTNEDICERVLTCKKSQKSYKIIPQEFAYYKKNNIPLPDLSFYERHKARLARRNPRKLWERTCNKCHKKIRTPYAPDRPEKVYCENCYLKEVY